MTTTMTPLDTVKDVEKVREQAIAFYEQEHNLDADERKQLYVFYEQQTRRMLLGFSCGVALGTALPFIVKKKGALVHPAIPVLGAVVGGSIVPGLVNHQIYNMQVQQYRQKFGENSPICLTISKTPDPITKSVFWSNYFKTSSQNPNFRMRDPTTVTDSHKFFSIADVPKVPPYGKPGYYKNDERDGPPQTFNQQYRSSWDKVRNQSFTSGSGSSTTSPPVDHTYSMLDTPQSQSQSQLNSDPLSDGFEESASTIGDSYDSVYIPAPVPEQSQTSTDTARHPLRLDHDELIQNEGVSGSTWEKIRRESGR